MRPTMQLEELSGADTSLDLKQTGVGLETFLWSAAGKLSKPHQWFLSPSQKSDHG